VEVEDVQKRKIGVLLLFALLLVAGLSPVLCEVAEMFSTVFDWFYDETSVINDGEGGGGGSWPNGGGG
jgi:hypothetical protein